MSISWQSVDEPVGLLVLPPAAASLDEAHAAIEQWEHYSGKTLDAEQRLTVEVMMAEADDGRWAAMTTGKELSRQNGKGDEIEVVESWGILQRGEAILHTAHELPTVSSAHQRMLGLVESSPDLRRRVKKVLNGLGQQMIEIRGGGIISYRTRTSGGGRGLDDISRLVVDEAQHVQLEQLASSSPILLANPNPQTNYVGTGGIAGSSHAWWGIRKRALAPSSGRFGYVGVTAERVYLDADGLIVQVPVDIEDRAVWRRVNPALRSGRSTIEFFEEQYAILGPAVFAREHLWVWDPPPAVGESAGKIPAAKWTATGLERGSPPRPSRLAFDVSPDGEWSSVAWAGGSLAAPYVEVARHEKGTDWVVAQLVRMQSDIGSPRIAWDASGPASMLVPALRESLTAAGLDPEVLRAFTGPEMRSACGAFVADVIEGDAPRLRRAPAQGDLLATVLRHAVERPIGDGGWVWGRQRSTVPVSPLVAVTIARALLAEADVVTQETYLGPLVAFR